MKLDRIRIYFETFEQGLDFKQYILKSGFKNEIQLIYKKKYKFNDNEESLVNAIRKVKDVDILITCISDNKEYPLLIVEYSSSVPTDDHKMQRSDNYFWGSIFKVPSLKISSKDKGMNNDFGGGNRINNSFERYISYNFGAVHNIVEWNSMENNSDFIETKDQELSCIHYSEELFSIISDSIEIFSNAKNYSDYFVTYRNKFYKNIVKEISKFNNDSIKNIIVNSSRFKWRDNKLITKINRFGHAMDPDRGVLYFINMSVGWNNTITEFQINRNSNFNARQGYKSMLDAISKEKILTEYIKNIINKKNNMMSVSDAVYIFMNALNIENDIKLKKITSKKFIIEDKILEKFMLTKGNITPKSIFFLSSQLILTDVNRNVICEISWNRKPIEKFYESISVYNFEPLEIIKTSSKDIKEDIITYSSVQLYKLINYKLLAVSYPGAQGDRAILEGDGRNVIRTYVDIIAYHCDKNSCTVLLQECKDTLDKSKNDDVKLNSIRDEKLDNLQNLFRRCISVDSINDVYISLGAKYRRDISSFNVDYIFLFDLNDNNNEFTEVQYAIAIINPVVANLFKDLANSNNRLIGSLKFDIIYKIID